MPTIKYLSALIYIPPLVTFCILVIKVLSQSVFNVARECSSPAPMCTKLQTPLDEKFRWSLLNLQLVTFDCSHVAFNTSVTGKSFSLSTAGLLIFPFPPHLMIASILHDFTTLFNCAATVSDHWICIQIKIIKPLNAGTKKIKIWIIYRFINLHQHLNKLHFFCNLKIIIGEHFSSLLHTQASWRLTVTIRNYL